MRMTFKRGAIGGLIVFTGFVGLYLCFFNHPPAADTLEANAHHILNQDVGKAGPPKFSEFGPPKLAGGFVRSIQSHNDTAKQANDKALRDRDTDMTAIVASKRPPVDDHYHGNGDEKKPKPLVVDNNLDTVKQNEEKENTAVHNSDESKDAVANDVVNDGRLNAKEGEEKTEIENDGGTGAADHHFPKFDWDKWVKENNLVDIGTIWGYCDDPEPPEVGKVLLTKDEDRGGLKLVMALNTTFDEPVELGFIFVSVMYGEMNFYEKTMDICTLFEDDEPEPDVEKDTFFDCPMKEGNKYYTKELHVPFFVPSGHFRAKAKLTDQEDRTVICASADVTL